jgi:hypothetical protein
MSFGIGYILGGGGLSKFNKKTCNYLIYFIPADIKNIDNETCISFSAVIHGRKKDPEQYQGLLLCIS